MIPSSVTICDRVYTVTVQPMGVHSTGACCNCRQDITIDDGSHPETQACVLLHEVLEAINSSMNLELPHNTITSLESAMYGVLTSNEPWWDRHFIDDEKEVRK